VYLVEGENAGFGFSGLTVAFCCGGTGSAAYRVALVDYTAVLEVGVVEWLACGDARERVDVPGHPVGEDRVHRG
jgi:hypothetical protein